MKKVIAKIGLAGAVLISGFFATPTYASLVTFQTYVGQNAVSTDGSDDTIGTLTANAPAGSTVIAAYLYTATYGTSPNLSGVTLNGTSVTYGATFPNATACCDLSSSRADVTAIVAPIINGGAGGAYNFAYAEGAGAIQIDGSALVVVYSNPALSTHTIGILQGFASVTGDTGTLNFGTPLDPTAAGFVAELRLGIGFSCGASNCGGEQSSTVTVNGTLITEKAGNLDDGSAVANGSLITMGGDNDPFSPFLPSYADDHERYNLIPQITLGDTSITVSTANASQDDNIFLAVFDVTGEATIVTPGDTPLPAAAWLFGSVLGAAAIVQRRRRKRLTTA